MLLFLELSLHAVPAGLSANFHNKTAVFPDSAKTWHRIKTSWHLSRNIDDFINKQPAYSCLHISTVENYFKDFQSQILKSWRFFWLLSGWRIGKLQHFLSYIQIIQPPSAMHNNHCAWDILVNFSMELSYCNKYFYSNLRSISRDKRLSRDMQNFGWFRPVKPRIQKLFFVESLPFCQIGFFMWSRHQFLIKSFDSIQRLFPKKSS